MKIKKMLSLMLAAMLLIGTTACSPKTKNSSSDSVSNSVSASASSTGSIPSYLNLDNNYPVVTGDPITLTVDMTQAENYTTSNNANDYWFWAWAKKYTNINFDVNLILTSALDEQKQLLFAAGDLPDIMIGFNMTTSELENYGEVNQQLLALNNYITEELTPAIYQTFEAMPDARTVSKCLDGNLYTLPYIKDENDTAGNGRLFINQKWLADVGMSTPETLDDFVAMLEAFKEKAGDGVIPEGAIALGGCSAKFDPSYYILNALGFLTTDSSGTTACLRDGEVTIPCGDKNYLEFLTVMNKLYTNSLISEEFFTMDKTEFASEASQGLLGIIGQAPYVYLSDTFTDWKAVKPLTSDVNSKQQWLKCNPFMVGGFELSADCKYPEVAMKLADFFFTDQGATYKWEGPNSEKDDTLGMVGGYSISDDNGLSYVDVEQGKYTSGYQYILSSIVPNDITVGNSMGLENTINGTAYVKAVYYAMGRESELGLDKNSGEGAYRSSVKANLLPYAVEGYPSVVYFSEEVNEKITDLKTVIRNYVATETAKFITGARPLSEFDDYLSELGTLGYKDYLQYYADYYNNNY